MLFHNSVSAQPNVSRWIFRLPVGSSGCYLRLNQLELVFRWWVNRVPSDLESQSVRIG